MTRFINRGEAGRELAGLLRAYADRPDVIVLALPRGGVPVAAEVAAMLDAPLDVLAVRKLGVPWNEEFALGALAPDDIVFLDREVIQAAGLTRAEVARVLVDERHELSRRERLYRDGRPEPALEGRTVILVDDGLATGSTMRVAVEAVRRHRPAHVIVAVPVASPEACRDLAGVADGCTCAATPEPFGSVGAWYLDFGQVTDSEVIDLLRRAARRHPERAAR